MDSREESAREKPMHKIFATMAFVLMLAASAQAQVVPECELVETTSPDGNRVTVGIVLPSAGLPLDRVGLPRFVVEVHVSPSEIRTETPAPDNDFRGLQACTYPSGRVVSHVKLRAVPTKKGPLRGNLLTTLELPASAVDARVVVRTMIGAQRYVGVWKKKQGRDLVFLERQ